jgi:succinate dehydrogenase / fumarate reductase flavoprotein subunit
MGKFAGEKAQDYLSDAPFECADNAGEFTFSLFSKLIEKKGSENLEMIREHMRSVMTENVGVFRSRKSLHEAVEALLELQERAFSVTLSTGKLTMNQELVQRWELENLLTVAMITAQSALMREESRGGHFRTDFPSRNDEYNHHTLAYMPNYGEVKYERRPVDMSIYEARGEHYDKFGMIERTY